MYRFSFSIPALFLVVLAAAQTGCAARRAEALARMPVADTVCLQVDGIKDPEKGLLFRKAEGFLSEEGFRLVGSNCDLKLVYTALDQGQWEILTASLLGRKSEAAYRVEGVLSVWRREEQITQDQKIDLRDYDSKTEIIEALAEEIVDYVTDGYRPLMPPHK